MKHILLSADSMPSVYLVPDEVADNLREYCVNFCDKWLSKSPDAKKYRVHSVVCYNEKDFIEYLNKWIFPNQPSVFIEKLDSMNNIPEKYSGCKRFDF